MNYLIIYQHMIHGAQSLLSLFHTPSAAAREIFHQIVRAGWIKAEPDYRVERQSCPGDDLLFCLNGAGFVMVRGKTFSVTAGQVVWIDCHHSHAHWADPKNPWELYWLRWNAPWLDATARILAIKQTPVFPNVNRHRFLQTFQRVFDLMTHRPPALESLLHAEAAQVVANLFEARAAEPNSGFRPVQEVDVGLREAFTKMSLYPHRPWRLAQLAKLSRLSVPHFCRRFRHIFHMAPIDWLRQERLNQARHRLLESNDSIKEIAEQIGYNDASYFSRDFKRHTGMSPLEYRRK